MNLQQITTKAIAPFYKQPAKLMALKVSLSMALLSIPFLLWGNAFIAITLALGVIAGALAETYDHPRGRTKALFLTIISFGIATFSVELLLPYPWLLGAWFILSTIVFTLIGGLGERYRGITFGAILIGMYAMLGAHGSTERFWQAIFLPAGALAYGLFSLALLYHKPWRPIEESLAEGFSALSVYLQEKSQLFPSTKEEQATIRHKLALLNVQVVTALEKCKNVLNAYTDEVQTPEDLKPYLQRFILLQGLHERAASSHEKYEKLSSKPENREVVEGLGEMLQQLSRASALVAKSMLSATRYTHPASLDWIVTALQSKLEKLDESTEVSSLILLFHNLKRSHLSLKNMHKPEDSTSLPKLSKDTRSLWDKFKAQLNLQHPRLRYAIRLSTCFAIGFAIVHALQIEKGVWVMLTSFFVCQPTYSDTRKRFFQRILGTLTGVLAGILLVQIIPTEAGQILLMLASAFAFFYWLRANYSIAVIFITLFVICAFNLISAEGIEVMIPRILDTLLGAVLAILTVRMLWPDWHYKNLPKLLANALSSNALYFRAILQESTQSDSDDLNYRIVRRQAHMADNELALSWNGMRLDPKKKQELLSRAFTLTYQNHALLSYISALAAHRDTQAFSYAETENIALKIEEALNKTGEHLRGGADSEQSFDLIPTLLQLRQGINASTNQTERLQLRMLYNIADVSNKLLLESKELWNTKSATPA